MSKALTRELIMARCKSDNIRLLKNLNLWGNDITDVSLLREMVNIEVLSLSINKISTLRDFINCQKLRELYLRRNNIKDLSEVRYLQNLPMLQTIWLSENPCADHPNYRKLVIKMLPNLIKLDNQDVTSEERQEAMASGGGGGEEQGIGNYQAYGGDAGYQDYEEQREDDERDFKMEERRGRGAEDNHKDYYSGSDKQNYGSRGYRDSPSNYDSGKNKRKENRGRERERDRVKKNPYFREEKEEVDNYEPPASNRRGRGERNRAEKFIQNENVVSAILALIKELNTVELDFLRREIEKRISKKKFE